MSDDGHSKRFMAAWESGPQLSFEMIEAGEAVLKAASGRPAREVACDIFVAMWHERFPEAKSTDEEYQAYAFPSQVRDSQP